MSITNCLATKFPEVAKQWHPTKNGTLTPFDVLSKTGKKFWWICDKNHEYSATVSHRTFDARGCPICNESKGEKKIREILKKLNIEFEPQFWFDSCRNQKPLPFDFFISSRNLLIEYQGKKHFQPLIRSTKITKEKEETALLDYENLKINDEIKRSWCKENNIDLLEIPYWDYQKI